tara:strand:- start:43 stop:291 length:249 start_codon:yes stop_codon:yes gene_type:complete
MSSTNSDQIANNPEQSELKPIENKENEEILSQYSATTDDIPNFGWSNYAERINGRFAMIGFIAILMIELISHQTFLQWASLH